MVPFCYEQAIGFSCLPNLIPDKDGVSAAAVVAEMAGQLAAAGQSVTHILPLTAAVHSRCLPCAARTVHVATP